MTLLHLLILLCTGAVLSGCGVPPNEGQSTASPALDVDYQSPGAVTSGTASYTACTSWSAWSATSNYECFVRDCDNCGRTAVIGGEPGQTDKPPPCENSERQEYRQYRVCFPPTGGSSVVEWASMWRVVGCGC